MVKPKLLPIKTIHAVNHMKPFDLTHTISPNMPVYPGTEPPVFTTGCSIDETGFLEKKITLFSHTGTHIDAPAHLLKGHKTLDMLPIEHFYGPALLLNFTDFTAKSYWSQRIRTLPGKHSNCRIPIAPYRMEPILGIREIFYQLSGFISRGGTLAEPI